MVDADEAKKMGAEDFKRRGVKLTIQEINIDLEKLQEMQQKKQEILKQQNQAKPIPEKPVTSEEPIKESPSA